MVTTRTSLSLQSIKALRTINDSLMSLGGKPENLPITKSLIKRITAARATYKDSIQKSKASKSKEDTSKAEAEQKQVEIEKENINSRLREFHDMDRIMEREMSVANNLMKEASAKIKTAIQNKNVENIGVAQAMMESAQTKLDEIQQMQNKQNSNKRKFTENLSHSRYRPLPKQSKIADGKSTDFRLNYAVKG